MKFRKLHKVFIARLFLCLMVFGSLGALSTPVFGTVIIAEAKDATEQPKQDDSTEKDYDTAMDEAQEEYDSKNIKNLTKDIKPESNTFTNVMSHPFILILNAIMYVALTLINTYFFVQTCFDIAFLIAPAMREALSGHQNTEGGSGKVARAINGLISEAALNAVGYNKSADSKRHIECSEMAKEVDWKGWLVRRLVMFVSMMAYLALLMMGLVDDFVALFTKLGYAIVKSIMDLLGA